MSDDHETKTETTPSAERGDLRERVNRLREKASRLSETLGGIEKTLEEASGDSDD